MMNGDYHTHGRRPSKILKEKLGALQEMQLLLQRQLQASSLEQDVRPGRWAMPCLLCGVRYGYKPHTVHEYEQLTNKIRKEMATRNLDNRATVYAHPGV